MEGENPSLTPQAGELYVIATPIGNLADLSERAIALLGRVSLVACEDTRVTGLLLNRLDSKKPLVSYHDRNELQATERVVTRLQAGDSVALVSDAGTPAISDPGFRIVRECRRVGLPVVPVPGPCAATTLLCASGLPTNAFFFAGFLPPKSAARIKFLESHAEFPHTIILYESCHRIEKLIDEAMQVLGPDRYVSIGREITKRFESIKTGKLSEIRAFLETSSKKGEFVVAIAPAGYEL